MPTAEAGVATAVALLVAAHLLAERRGWRTARAVTKVAASLAFVLLALLRGADGAFERGLVAGLVLSVAGDALLLFKRRAAFLAGLVAFLLAHVSYALSFAVLSDPSPWVAVPIVAALAWVLRWLWPHLLASGGLRAPVVAYCLVISAMLWLALGVDRPEIRLGAALFYASDLFVARDRFVRAGLANRLVGLPLYYAAQVLLALAV